MRQSTDASRNRPLTSRAHPHHVSPSRNHAKQAPSSKTDPAPLPKHQHAQRSTTKANPARPYVYSRQPTPAAKTTNHNHNNNLLSRTHHQRSPNDTHDTHNPHHPPTHPQTAQIHTITGHHPPQQHHKHPKTQQHPPASQHTPPDHTKVPNYQQPNPAHHELPRPHAARRGHRSVDRYSRWHHQKSPGPLAHTTT